MEIKKQYAKYLEIVLQLITLIDDVINKRPCVRTKNLPETNKKRNFQIRIYLIISITYEINNFPETICFTNFYIYDTKSRIQKSINPAPAIVQDKKDYKSVSNIISCIIVHFNGSMTSLCKQIIIK